VSSEEGSHDYAAMALGQFLDELASGNATPGGGAASAVAGAMGAALVSMVCRLTIGRKKYEQYERDLQAVLARAEGLRPQFIAQAQADAAAYERVITAMKMPKDTPEQESARRQVLDEALKQATIVPLRTAAMAMEVMHLAREVKAKGNRNAASDAAVAFTLGATAFEGGLANASINIPLIKDLAFAAGQADKVTALRREFATLQAADATGE